MTHRCCLPCRVRFEGVAYGDERCPHCGGELEPALPSRLVGFRLATNPDPGALAQAIAATAALPLPDPAEDM